jgi:transmembrane sensor
MTQDSGSDDREEQERWEMVHRFLDGLSSLPERRIVEKWAADDLSLRRYLKAHRKVWSLIGRRPGEADPDPGDAWESMRDRMAERDRRERFSLPGRGLEHLRVIEGGMDGAPPVRRAGIASRLASRLTSRLALGAAAAVVITASVVVWRGRGIGPAAERVLRGAPVTYTTPRGERRTVRLPDGTDVVMAPATQLRYAVERAGAVHGVALVGQASFHVTHRADREFVVRAGGVETRDLGTVFDVRAYPGALPEVAVESGRVALRAERGGAPSSMVSGGSVAIVDPASGSTVIRPLTPASSNWMHGRLEFADAPLRDVMVEMGRAYDLDFSLADTSLAARSVTFTVNGGTAEEALQLLALTLHDVKYSRHGREVRLFRE